MFLEHLDTVIAFAVMMLLLSLIITSLVQMFAGLFNLRGKNLLWGTEQLLRQLDPRLTTEARTLADRILRHAALTHRAGRHASAIRPSELVLVLGQISRGEIQKAERPADSTDPAEQPLSPAAVAALK